MSPEWVLRALTHKGIGQAELGRQLSAALGYNVDRAAVNKMIGRGGKKPRKITWAEARAISRITGLPLPEDDPPQELRYEPLEENDPRWRPDSDDPTTPYSGSEYRPSVPGAMAELNVEPGAGEGRVGPLSQYAIRNGDTYSGHEVVGEWLFPEPFVRHQLGTSPSRAVVMKVVGDSMEPTFRPDDRVIVDLTQTTMVADTVYVIDDRIGPPQIKRLQRVLFSDPVMVHIISDNPAHRTDPPVELARVNILGRVCGHVARR
jgi:hypothetical protein